MGKRMAGCDHNWVKVSETAHQVVHRCTKCHETYTRSRGNLAFAYFLWQLRLAIAPAPWPRRAAHVGRAYAVAGLVMAAVCVAATIWAGGAS